MSESCKTRVILVGIGGATCSGKTTLAKHLKRILPNSVIIHQDVRSILPSEYVLNIANLQDFAPVGAPFTTQSPLVHLCQPQEKIPVHPIYQVQDWDAPQGAIDWPRLIAFLQRVKETGVIPPDHRSHDHLNEQKQVALSDSTREKWTSEFQRLSQETEVKGEKIIWGLVDGFLLYWHPEVIKQLDVRIFLRVPHDVLKHRRHERHGYHTAVQSDPEGSLWRDPPMYWEQIVWPAYLEANRDIFIDGNVETGMPSDKVQELLLINGLELRMDEIVEKSCAALKRKVEGATS
ncbi:ribosylnicotinamide kinase [Paramarasmius palmivorus]|uniref:Ribosylnicotinamide kinase n=1 Tax=Paramarasmius palmivorus TaxID=297713 RepID=A0AAW0D2T0_9AGAR